VFRGTSTFDIFSWTTPRVNAKELWI
jgi:hypothetical protein